MSDIPDTPEKAAKKAAENKKLYEEWISSKTPVGVNYLPTTYASLDDKIKPIMGYVYELEAKCREYKAMAEIKAEEALNIAGETLTKLYKMKIESMESDSVDLVVKAKRDMERGFYIIGGLSCGLCFVLGWFVKGWLG